MPIAEPDVEVPAGDVTKGAKLFKAKCAQLSGTESSILNRESSESESCDPNHAMPWFLEALIRCDSDGDSESIFRDSTLLRFNSFFCFSLQNFLRFQARDYGNRAIRDSRFCAAKVLSATLSTREALSSKDHLSGASLAASPARSMALRTQTPTSSLGSSGLTSTCMSTS